MEGVSAMYTNYPSLPSFWVLATQEPRHVPTFAAVYIILDVNRYVKYVGQMTNLRSRYKDHLKKVIREGDALGWLKCEQEELMFLECWFIATLRPYLNGNDANKRSRKAATALQSKVKCKTGADVARWSKGLFS
jgi:excinuclease UvrABC nuclease subunit